MPTMPPGPAPTETAVIVIVDEAEPVVGRFRARLDRAAGWGVAPHVTVLYPFLPPRRLDGGVLRALATAVASVPAFDVTFARVRWFGDTAVWLAPEPAEPFRSLTMAVWRSFPECPPYGGAHAGVVPHLTVGHDAPAGVLRAAATSVQVGLPIHARVTAAWLMQGTDAPGSWRGVAELPLG